LLFSTLTLLEHYDVDQRKGFYPSCESMVDKIGWTEPLGSGGGELDFVRLREWGKAKVRLCFGERSAAMSFMGRSQAG
jgi:hypothetical protein